MNKINMLLLLTGLSISSIGFGTTVNPMMTRFLLDDAETNVQNLQNSQAQFIEAIISGSIEKVQEALNNGANINAVNALHISIDPGTSNNINMTRFLLENGARVNLRSVGETSLHTAAVHGQVQIIELLLQHGADYFCRTSDNWDEPKTALEIAIDFNHPDCAQLIENRILAYLQT